MSKKSRAALLGLLGLAALGMPDYQPNLRVSINTGGGDREKKRHINNLKRKGLKEFIINGETYYARNYKNALRKHNRKLIDHEQREGN